MLFLDFHGPCLGRIDNTASNLDKEHRLWYFREDLGVNLHHWHWNLVYPVQASDRSIVDKDRRGELFYYMHEQIIARYNSERFSNNLHRVMRLNNLRAPIAEGYFPKLYSSNASRAWAARAAGATLKDINRSMENFHVDLSELERWIERVHDAINQKFVINADGQRIELTASNGIDILGNIVEASMLSPNREFHGNLHNFDHVFISYSHDPDGRHLEDMAVMGTTVRKKHFPY